MQSQTKGSQPNSPHRSGMASGGTLTPISTDTPHKGKNILVQVIMLDDTEALFKVPQQAEGKVLFDQVCKSLNLLESDYFGLEYTDLMGNKCWLDLTKPMWKQVGGISDPKFQLCVKFYTPDPGQLEEEYTRYLFALQIKKDLVKGVMPCTDQTAAKLASYIVQAECGDYSEDDYPDHTYLSSYKFIPHQTPELEKLIMENHKKHQNLSPADADFMLLDIARKTELYGIKMHKAKDHEGVSLCLAVAHYGITVFQHYTKINTFSWAKVRKLSFKRKRFLIKLHPEGHLYYKDTVDFYFEDRNKCKNFWKKCVEHHAFFRCASIKKPPQKKAKIFSKGSSFRYGGRTQKEMVDDVRVCHVRRQQLHRSLSGRISTRSLVNLGTMSSSTPAMNSAFSEPKMVRTTSDTSGSHHLATERSDDVCSVQSEHEELPDDNASPVHKPARKISPPPPVPEHKNQIVVETHMITDEDDFPPAYPGLPVDVCPTTVQVNHIDQAQSVSLTVNHINGSASCEASCDLDVSEPVAVDKERVSEGELTDDEHGLEQAQAGLRLVEAGLAQVETGLMLVQHGLKKENLPVEGDMSAALFLEDNMSGSERGSPELLNGREFEEDALENNLEEISNAGSFDNDFEGLSDYDMVPTYEPGFDVIPGDDDDDDVSHDSYHLRENEVRHQELRDKELEAVINEEIRAMVSEQITANQDSGSLDANSVSKSSSETEILKEPYDRDVQIVLDIDEPYNREVEFVATPPEEIKPLPEVKLAEEIPPRKPIPPAKSMPISYKKPPVPPSSMISDHRDGLTKSFSERRDEMKFKKQEAIEDDEEQNGEIEYILHKRILKKAHTYTDSMSLSSDDVSYNGPPVAITMDVAERQRSKSLQSTDARRYNRSGQPQKPQVPPKPPSLQKSFTVASTYKSTPSLRSRSPVKSQKPVRSASLSPFSSSRKNLEFVHTSKLPSPTSYSYVDDSLSGITIEEIISEAIQKKKEKDQAARPFTDKEVIVQDGSNNIQVENMQINEVSIVPSSVIETNFDDSDEEPQQENVADDAENISNLKEIEIDLTESSAASKPVEMDHTLSEEADAKPFVPELSIEMSRISEAHAAAVFDIPFIDESSSSSGDSPGTRKIPPDATPEQKTENLAGVPPHGTEEVHEQQIESLVEISPNGISEELHPDEEQLVKTKEKVENEKFDDDSLKQTTFESNINRIPGNSAIELSPDSPVKMSDQQDDFGYYYCDDDDMVVVIDESLSEIDLTDQNVHQTGSELPELESYYPVENISSYEPEFSFDIYRTLEETTTFDTGVKELDVSDSPEDEKHLEAENSNIFLYKDVNTAKISDKEFENLSESSEDEQVIKTEVKKLSHETSFPVTIDDDVLSPEDQMGLLDKIDDAAKRLSFLSESSSEPDTVSSAELGLKRLSQLSAEGTSNLFEQDYVDLEPALVCEEVSPTESSKDKCSTVEENVSAAERVDIITTHIQEQLPVGDSSGEEDLSISQEIIIRKGHVSSIRACFEQTKHPGDSSNK